MTRTRILVSNAKKALKRRLGPGTTRYDRFCTEHDIKNRDLAKHSNYTATHHRAVRYGINEPTMDFVAAAVRAVRQIIDNKTITAEQLFDLEGDNDETNSGSNTH
jgi:hypothetical protein